jgi:hypothetical protein
MGYFSVRVVDSKGEPLKDIGVMVDYGLLYGIDEKRTGKDGWVEFHNHGDEPGRIWVHGHNMGDHSLRNGKTYSFAI